MRTPPITEDEWLYRRIPAAWFKPGKTKRLPQRAFMPRPWVSNDKPGDCDGLSTLRAILINSIESAATHPNGSSKMHLVEISVHDVRATGLSVEPVPLPDEPAHAVIPEMNSLDLRDRQKQDRIEEWAIALRNKATLVYEAPSN